MTILLTKQRYKQELRNPHSEFVRSLSWLLGGRQPTPADYGTIQREYMSTRMVNIGGYTERRTLRFSKNVRPWFFVSPASVLPADEVWVGFEVETGYDNAETLRSAVQTLGRCRQLVAIDVEGSGRCPVEITFFPVALSDMEKKGGPSRIISMAKKHTPAVHAPSACVGTHFNFSTPYMRSTRRHPFSCYSVGGGINMLRDEERLLLFGRGRVYGPAPYVHAADDSIHVECKWFNTTYDPAVWARYCRVMRGFLARVIETQADTTRQTEAQWRDFFRQLYVQERTHVKNARRSRASS